jgi:YidC/Oxa1 family membrane protein insertase
LPEIKNPNQQPGGLDGKSMLSMMLIFVMVFAGMTWYRQHNSNAAEPSPVQNSQAQTAPAATPAVNAATAPAAGAVTATPDATSVQAYSEQTTTVENELYRITFTNRGARVSSWILKRYTDDAGKPLDLVNSAAAKQFGYPLELYTSDSGLRTRIDNALFVPGGAAGKITGNSLDAPTDISFDYAAGGLKVHKEFRFDQSYVLHAAASVTLSGAPVQAMLAWPSALGDDVTPLLYNSSQVDTAQGSAVSHLAPKKISGGSTLNGPFDWAAMSDLYFAAVFLPDSPDTANVVTLRDELSVPRDAKDPNTKYDQVPILGTGIGERNAGTIATRVYVGPKALDILKTIHSAAPGDKLADGGTPTGPSLEPLIDFGFWGILAKPLFLWLHWTYDHMVHNWGWSILILTVCINLAVLPLRITSMKSSLKMQKIQPQVTAIREKYKKYKMGDPKQAEMNQELGALYKSEGVNMFGGCLPMLIQFPILIAFYNMLAKAVDLRHAHWLWLPDLSRPDALHILPVFFIVTMFLTQYLTPAPGMDPAQKKMMAFMMPAMFGFWTWSIASGVALYWAGGNIIGILSQLAMNRSSLGDQMREVAAKRARRKLGQGKVIQGKR